MKGRTEDSIIDLVPHFILFLSKISKIRHICVGLRTPRLLVYLLGRQLPVPHVTISMTSLSDVSISNSNSFAKQPNGEQTKLWALNKVIFRQKIRFFAKITVFTMNQKWTNSIENSLYRESWLILPYSKFMIFCCENLMIFGGNFYLNWIFVW